METTRKGVLWLTIAASAYGSSVVMIKSAVSAGLNAETAMAIRFTMATLVWAVILIARREHLWAGIRPVISAAGIGGLFYTANSLSFYRGTALVSGTVASVTVAIVPVVVAFFARIVLGESLGWRGWLALALSVVGGVVLAGGPAGSVDRIGLLWLGGAVLFYSLYVVFSTRLTRTLAPSLTAFYVISGSAVLYWIWGGLGHRFDFGFEPRGLLAIAALALVSTVLALSAFLAGAHIVGATRAAIVSALEPVVGALLAVLILGDRPTPLQIAGGALIIVAALLVQRTRPANRNGTLIDTDNV
jgi:drug/metabolite transporter (DMT)-like permease